MPGSVLRSLASLSLVAVLATGCTATRAPVDTMALSGWTPLGEGTYLCEPPACPSLRLAGYDVVSLGPAGQAIFDTNNQATREAFEDALRDQFARDAPRDGIRLRIDGPITRTMVGANESLTFALVGTDSDGGRADPGHAIIVPKDGAFHMVFAFSDTKAAARATARQFVNAISI